MPIALLELRDVGFTYAGSPHPTLRDISFSIESRESTAIIGLSGSGKSTLLRLIAGFERPSRGTIQLRGAHVAAPSRQVAVVFQNYNDIIFDWLTTAENIALGLGSGGDLEVVQRIAEDLGLTSKLNRRARNLSGGERQRAAIGRALAQQAPLVLLDEPFASLDTLARSTLIEILRRVEHDSAATFIVVSHDIEEALLATDRALCLMPSHHEPQIVEAGRAATNAPKTLLDMIHDTRFATVVAALKHANPPEPHP